MAEITPTSIAAAVAKQIPAFFNDAFDQFGQGEGGYLANGQPEGAVAKVGQAVGRAACRRFGAQPGGNFANSERFERACRPYLDTLTPGQGLELDLPWTGGQCEEVLYRATGDILHDLTNCSTGVTSPRSNPVTTEIQWVGPIVSVTATYSNPGACGNRSFSMEIVHGGGQFVGNFGFTTNAINALSNARFVGSFTDATQAEGNCGFPPPTVRQPRPIADPTPPPFRFNPGPDVDVGIDVSLNPDGSINVNLGGGDTTVNPFPDDDAGGGGDGTPGDATDPGLPGPGGDTGDGGDTDGEAEPDEELVGVLVEVLGTPENPNEFSNNAARVFRGVGYVRMGFAGRLGTDVSGGAVLSPQFFHAQQRGLTNWEVKANLGFNLRATPYYRTIEP